MTRTVTFSAGHRYWFAELSEGENQSLFGSWASPYSHGHQYVLRVTVEGEIDERTGMILNIKTLDEVLQRQVVTPFDKRSLNDEIEEFKHRAPTLENLLTTIADRLADLPPQVQLKRLELEESPDLIGGWALGQKLTITRTYEFAASHRLHSTQLTDAENQQIFGKCNWPNGHGHNYVLEVTVSGEPDERTGMIVDLGSLDKAVNYLVIDRYDHRNLNLDIEELRGLNPTSEVVATAIFRRLDGQVPGELLRVRLHETARNCFEVSR